MLEVRLALSDSSRMNLYTVVDCKTHTCRTAHVLASGRQATRQSENTGWRNPLIITCLRPPESRTTVQTPKTSFDKQNCLHHLPGISICMHDRPSSKTHFAR